MKVRMKRGLKKKKWVRPILAIVVKEYGQEMVLAACKYGSQAGPSGGWGGGQTGCVVFSSCWGCSTSSSS